MLKMDYLATPKWRLKMDAKIALIALLPQKYILPQIYSTRFYQFLMAQTEIPKDLLTIANFLLSSSSQLRLRQGVLSGNRAEFF